LNPEIDRRCFVCGPENEAGLHARFTCGEGRASGCCTLRPEHQGYQRAPHGGIISALLDEAMVYAAASLGRWVATAELQVRFRQPGVIGENLLIEGEVTGRRGRIVEARAALQTSDGAVLATATGRLLQLREIRPEEQQDLAARQREEFPCD